MLILPVINRGKNGKKISNAKIELVNCKRLGDNSSINTKVGPENVIIDGKDLASSRNYSKKDLMKFIKDNSINSKKDFFINTKNSTSIKKEYDSIGNRLDTLNDYHTYVFSNPYKFPGFKYEELYNRILLDIINEVPGVEGNAHLLSFKDIGLDKVCTKEKLQKLEAICNSVSDTSKWDNLFEQAGVYDLAYFTYFLRSDFVRGTVVPETSIQFDDLSTTIGRFSPLHGRVYKSLNRYRTVAEENTEIYRILNSASMLLFNESLGLVKSVKQRENNGAKVMKFSNGNSSRGDYDVAA